MNLDLQRTAPSGTSTIGTLSVNGRFECFRLDDTQGCILVGLEQGTDRIAAGKPAFDHLFVQLEAALRSKETILLHIH